MVSLVTVLAAAGAGCGDSDRGYNKGFRPPVTRNISVVIEKDQTKIAPREIGGGPATIKITNQSGQPVANVRLRSLGGSGCLSDEAASGPIPASGTGTVTATLVEGVCELVVNGAGQAKLAVIGERPSAQNKLLLP